jgi:hypothetical protein
MAICKLGYCAEDNATAAIAVHTLLITLLLVVGLIVKCYEVCRSPVVASSESSLHQGTYEERYEAAKKRLIKGQERYEAAEERLIKGQTAVPSSMNHHGAPHPVPGGGPVTGL